MSASRYVHIRVKEILRSTNRALLVLLEDGSEEWIPLSQIADPDDYDVGDCDLEMAVTWWIANEKGLEVEDEDS